MKTLRRWLSLLLLSICLAPALAQDAMETIRLNHRLADQLIPELRSLLAPGGAMTGSNELLIIRTTPANLEQLRQVIATLDRPSRRLLISVRHDGQASNAQSGAGARIEIRPGGSTVQGRVVDTRRSTRENVAQQVQTIEGGRAFIQAGQSLPIPMRQYLPVPGGYAISDSVVYRDIGSGFYVQPRLSGDRVMLEISTANDATGTDHGSVEVRRIATTVSGRLGEWLPLGGVTRQVDRDGRGLSGYAAAAGVESRQVWLKVDALD